MSSWKEVAIELFPGQDIKEPIDLYVATARKMLSGAVKFTVVTDADHKGFIGLEIADEAEGPIDRALDHALGIAAYSVGSNAFYRDMTERNENSLYDLLGEIDCQHKEE